MRKLASIRRIGEVRAIEGADAIEAVQIDQVRGKPRPSGRGRIARTP